MSKSANHKAGKRRQTLEGGMGGVIGEVVYIPGSPVTTLGGLLNEVEREVAATPMRDAGRTPESLSRRVVSVHDKEEQVIGRREWAKDDWRVLDACFTDLRVESGGGNEDMMADVDAVLDEDVVRRFMEMMGGESVIEELGWARCVFFCHLLRTRADAFITLYLGMRWCNEPMRLERSSARDAGRRPRHLRPRTFSMD